MGLNLSTNQACRECGAYIGESAFCTRCGTQRGGAPLNYGRPTTAAERLGVSYAPPAQSAGPSPVFTPTYSESAAAWSSESASAVSPYAPKRFGFVKMLVSVIVVVAIGKGALIGYEKAKEALKPAPLAQGDCISFDKNGTNPHVSSCGEIHFGEVVKEVKQSSECTGITDYWIEKDKSFFCIKRTPS